jgi:hypothetical protein
VTRTTTQSDTNQLTDLEDFARVLGTRTLCDGEREVEAAMTMLPCGGEKSCQARRSSSGAEKAAPRREAGPGMLARLCLEV